MTRILVAQWLFPRDVAIHRVPLDSNEYGNGKGGKRLRKKKLEHHLGVANHVVAIQSDHVF